MVNILKLKGKIVEQGMNISDLANAINVNKSTLYRKLNGQCPFTILDADVIVAELKLSVSDACAIFFSQLVGDTRKDNSA